MRNLTFFIYLISANNTDNSNVVASTACRTSNSPDYYWREFTGTIPDDAIPGGLDRNGKPTYIGQVLVYPFGLLPASIYLGKEAAVASANLTTYHVSDNVKILCSSSPEKFTWIPTNTEKIGLITNCFLLLGGVDNGYKENIGRVNYNEEIILGKVIRKPLSHDGLWIPVSNTEIKLTTYEVLAYDCKNSGNKISY